MTKNRKAISLVKKQSDHKTKYETENKTTLLDSSWLLLLVGDSETEVLNAVT